MNWRNITEIAIGVGIGIMATDVARATGELIVAVASRATGKKK